MTDRLKVLHIYKDVYPPVIGGIEMHIHDICAGLKDEFDFHVLVANSSNQTVVEERDDLTVHKMATWGRPGGAPLCPAFPFRLAALARQSDLLHYHSPNPTGELSHLLVRPATPALVTYHSDIVRQKWGLKLYAPFLRLFLRQMALILPTSRRYMDSSPFLQPIARKCRPISLGVDTHAFEDDPMVEQMSVHLRAQHGDRPLIGFVGRLRAYKGLPWLIRAMPDVAPAEARLIIAGAGPMDGELKELVRSLGLEDRVIFMGDVTEKIKHALLRAIDIFCLPSHLRSEAFGLSQIEAMACGKPVICCNLDSGVPYVNQHGATGLVVPPASSEALAEALNTLLGDEDKRQAMGRAARQRAEDMFDRSMMLRRISEVYRNLAGRNRPASR